MNIINTLTLRHIKTHKKRTVLTIVAIIVSVAMVTAVFTSAISFVKYFQNSTLEVDGNWHVQFTDEDYSLHKPFFATDENIDEFAARTVYGTTTYGIENSMASYNSTVFCAEKNWFEMRNVAASEGRLPENSHELLLTKRAMDEFDLNCKVGDKITVPVTVYNKESQAESTVNREYEVVGISDSFVSATDHYAVFTGLDSEALKNSEETVVVARYDKLDNSIYDKIEQTQKMMGFSGYRVNSELFNFSMIFRGNGLIVSLGLFAGILLIIIAVVSVFMIYDSFAVSYQERAKYLGMLASVGATKKQKRMSIYFEGLILGLISVPLGIISGIVGIAVTFKCIEEAFLSTVTYSTGSLKVYVNWFVIAGTVIASALTIFISMYIPARKASKTSAIDAIRQTGTVKVKKAKKLRTSRLAGKIFGYEGTLAVKNFKRNGKRSRNIVFSLSLSIVVFLTVANFSAMLSDVLKTSLILTPDIRIAAEYENKDALLNSVKENKKVDRYFYDTSVYATIDNAYFENIGEDEIGGVLTVFLDNASFDGYLKELGERTEKYHDKDNPAAIVFNSVWELQGKGKKVKTEPLKNLKGQSVMLSISESAVDENGEEIKNPVKKESEIAVGIQTAKQWSEDKFAYSMTSLPLIIMSEDHADSVLGDVKNSAQTEISIMCDDFDIVRTELINSIKERDSEVGFFIETPRAGYNEMNNLFTIAKVFIYGFITLISIISVLNIINTISNSMNERRREFAMLRSVGMTPKSFKRMIYIEAGRYGAKALLFSFPVGVLIHFAMYKSLSGSMDFGFIVHPIPYLLAIIAVFTIIGIALLYSIDKIRDDNIIETLKTDI